MIPFSSVTTGACFLENGKVFKKTSNGYKIKNGSEYSVAADNDSLVELLESAIFTDHYHNTYYINGLGQYHRDDGPAIILKSSKKQPHGKQKTPIKNGTQEWYVNGLLHRTDGPAVIREDGHKEWRVNGQRHRVDGPAVEHPNGDFDWWLNGELHRTDGPAVIREDGTKKWYLNGRLHRFDGPAAIMHDGSTGWFQNNLLHRTDGPAIEGADGTQFWAINGEKIIDLEVIKKINDGTYCEN